MNHEEAWTHLPDLLDERDDPPLLAHVRGCAACQRQLFLLGRVDRLLRESPAAVQAAEARRPRLWTARRMSALAAAVAVLAAASIGSFFAFRAGDAHDLVLRTPSGQLVGEAVMGASDSRNASLALDARGLPVERSHMFVLWAGDGSSTMRVGRFMVDDKGNCRVQFSIPATHDWHEFWVTETGSPAAVVART